MKKAFLAFLMMASIASAESMRYDVIFGGNKAGTQVCESQNKQQLHCDFEYNDRGRGPKISSDMTLDENFTPVSIHISGNDYYKAQIQEDFSLKDGKASWKNKAEQGEQALTAKAFYTSMYGVPQEFGLLARATIAAGGSLALLPAGDAHIRKIAERKVSANGKNQTVTLYAVDGLGFTPAFVWLDSSQTMFAAASSWSTVIVEGWNSVIPDLLKEQTDALSVHMKSMAQSLAHKAPSFAFIHSNLFDSETTEVHRNWTVVVSGNTIQAAGPDANVKVPANAKVIDATGKMLLPGLWDMHVHLGESDGPLEIANGITTVRDMANDTDFLLALRKSFDEGSNIGPRVLMAGFMDSPGPYQGPSKVLVDNEKDARAAVDKYKSLGYDQIKIYSSMKPELVPAIIDEAHKNGLRVSGHIPAFMTAEQCVKLGFNEIQHVNFLFLNFYPDVKDTRTPARFTAVGERAADLDFNSPKVRAFIQLLHDRKIVSDPTVATFDSLFTDRPGKISNLYTAIADRLPPQVRRGFLAGGLPVTAANDQRYRDSSRALLKMVKALYDAGVTIVAGTDESAFALPRELELYVQAGIPAPKVLQLDTIGAARVMHRDAKLASIKPGKLADLILVNGDPTTNISDVRKLECVMKDGVLYFPAEIDRAIGIKPQ